MKRRYIALLGLLACLLAPEFASAQALTYATVVTTCGSLPLAYTASTSTALQEGAVVVDINGNLCVNASVTASITGFTGNGNFATLTSTASSSASTALPAGVTLNITNKGTTAVSCVLATGTATATASKIVIQPGSSKSRGTGAGPFDHIACINDAGDAASNVVVVEGGSGLGNDSGGGSAGGGTGGNVNVTQFGSSNVATGTGVGGAGIPRVTVSSDSSLTANLGTLNGAGTAANQATIITAVQAIQASAATTATNTGAPIPTQAGTVIIGGVGLDQTTPGTTNATSLKYINTTAIDANSGNKSAGTQRTTLATDQLALAAWGQGATAATTPTSATAAGCNGVNAFPSAVTNGQMAVPNCDLDATSINRPWAPKARWVFGTTAAMTGTTSTQLLAAVASNKLYLTTLTCGNSHATVGTFVNVQDGSGGATLWTVPAAAVYGGATLNLVPPPSTTSGNGVFVVDATTGANVICSGAGYSGP